MTVNQYYQTPQVGDRGGLVSCLPISLPRLLDSEFVNPELGQVLLAGSR